jgi:hypothetical protein
MRIETTNKKRNRDWKKKKKLVCGPQLSSLGPTSQTQPIQPTYWFIVVVFNSSVELCLSLDSPPPPRRTKMTPAAP